MVRYKLRWRPPRKPLKRMNKGSNFQESDERKRGFHTIEISLDQLKTVDQMKSPLNISKYRIVDRFYPMISPVIKTRPHDQVNSRP